MLTDDRDTEVREDDIFLMLSGSPTGTGCSGNEKRKKKKAAISSTET